MQVLGCEVAALDTVHYSNHKGYKQFKGAEVPAKEVLELYDGLKQSHLIDFDVVLSGYAPDAQVVEAIGVIGRDLKLRSSTKEGSFFWVLDPVMGDEGRLYVNEDAVPAYKSLLRDADLILPNQFEVELLSDTKIESFADLADAIAKLHIDYRLPHIIVTSIRFDASSPMISVVGSSARADGSARLFQVDVPALDCFFSGTGDMFAALTVAWLRHAVVEQNLSGSKSWRPPDHVEAVDLPLAKATEKVLGSMHSILEKTKLARDEELGRLPAVQGEKNNHLRKTRAAEVRLVRNLGSLSQPEAKFVATAFRV
ncbi:MAG: hypothetical protein Q9167_001963 [Letrouitia subvulpina]